MDKRFFKCIVLAALFAVSDSVSAEIIKGKIVEVLLNAPLRDPVKYRLMGYELKIQVSF